MDFKTLTVSELGVLVVHGGTGAEIGGRTAENPLPKAVLRPRRTAIWVKIIMPITAPAIWSLKEREIARLINSHFSRHGRDITIEGTSRSG